MKSKVRVACFVLGTICLFQSCEKDTFPISEENESKFPENESSVQIANEILSDSALLSLLAEEKRIIKDIKTGKIKKRTGMEVSKSNPKKVYAHYMPWFQSKDFDGYWGQHWTMTNRNPDVIDANGKREIASHYYPLIGPYSSSDPDLHEYHFLMMKLCGIDGVIFDWYGSQNFYDYGLIKQATETFMDVLEDLDMDFSIMYEDRVAQQAVDLGLATDIVAAAQNDFNYIRDTYFTMNNFLTFDNKELFFVFGPEYLVDPTDWNTIFNVFDEGESPNFLTLWAAQNRVGDNAAGEFLWIAPDHLLAHDYYYSTYSDANLITVGSSYPGFDDYYTEGGWGTPHTWNISHNSGDTFYETLTYTHHESADFIQLATWNDFGEGTMLEPTEEYGFQHLELLQSYTEVNYTTADLQVALDLYHARKEFESSMEVQAYLDRSYHYIKESKGKRAKNIITAVHRFF